MKKIEKRKVEIFNFEKKCWQIKPFKDLKERDIIRMFEPGGTSITIVSDSNQYNTDDHNCCEYNVFKVVSKPYETEYGCMCVMVNTYYSLPYVAK